MRAFTRVMSSVGFWLVVIVMVGVAVFPLLWMVSVSLKPPAELLSSTPTLLPKAVTFHNYRQAWQAVPLARALANSTVIGLCTTVIALGVGSIAAYGFSRFRFRGRDLFSTAVLATQMLPGILFLLPLFLIYVTVESRLNIPMQNTYHGLVFTYSTFALPVAIWMLMSHFAMVPVSLEEAAMVDGCTRLMALRKIVLPLAAPGMAATGMFVFLLAWNEVLFASVLTGDQTLTYPMALVRFRDAFQVQWGPLMAAATMVMVPVVAVFLLAQRYITGGLMLGAVKQ